MSSLVETPCYFNPDLFMSKKKDDIAEAKLLCTTRCNRPAECLAQCLDYEFISGETMLGVHGGTTPEERARARGRKTA